MAIITLTTDFGEEDYYVPAFKGEILTACPSVQIIDISNNVPSFEVNHAAYILKNAFSHFPKGTIHIVRVFETNASNPQIIVCSFQGHYFIAPNNGILSMVFEESRPSAAVMIDHRRITIKTPHDLYCRAVKTIIYNGSLSDLGMPINDIEKRFTLKPVIYESSIRGVVQHIDHYGNVITNITKSDLVQGAKDKNLAIILRRNDLITDISIFYDDVPQGEQLARFNSKGVLEIAVNCGRANELLGLKQGDNIKIEYE